MKFTKRVNLDSPDHVDETYFAFDARGEKAGEAHVSRYPRSKTTWIKMIEAYPRGIGTGDIIIKEILKDADKRGDDVNLSASSEFGIPLSRLTGWYGKHGFETKRGSGETVGMRRKLRGKRK